MLDVSEDLEIFASSNFIYRTFKNRTTKVLIRLCGCAGWSVSLYLACNKFWFSRDEAHLIVLVNSVFMRPSHLVSLACYAL